MPDDFAESVWPSVTVQLPLYNEPNVAARLVDAAAVLRYPGRLEVQVLDDSTDETTEIVADRIRFWQSSGVAIAHVRRLSRNGFKAGALAHGLTLTDSALLAVFDADFIPPPDLLMRMVPHFCPADRSGTSAVNPPLATGQKNAPVHSIRSATRIGMVQARWGHLNRGDSLLTRVQAIYLDAHFAIESAARYLGGRFFNFNGTAGIWRREAIIEAGGWSASTLTEDLDLSYRAQLAGWSFVFLPEVVVPAELPASLSGFQDQQHRWAKGSIQTARKILPRILRSDLPVEIKREAFFQLTANAAYLLSLIVGVLLVPATLIRQRIGGNWTLVLDLAVFSLSAGSVLLFYVEGQEITGRRGMTMREMLTLLPLGIGISVRNSAAVIEGAFQRGGYFRRTPKRGTRSSVTGERPPRLPVGELVLAAFFLASLATFVANREWASLPFVVLFLTGYLYVTLVALGERARWSASRVVSMN